MTFCIEGQHGRCPGAASGAGVAGRVCGCRCHGPYRRVTDMADVGRDVAEDAGPRGPVASGVAAP
jgi:hypothetical protein